MTTTAAIVENIATTIRDLIIWLEPKAKTRCAEAQAAYLLVHHPEGQDCPHPEQCTQFGEAYSTMLAAVPTDMRIYLENQTPPALAVLKHTHTLNNIDLYRRFDEALTGSDGARVELVLIGTILFDYAEEYVENALDNTVTTILADRFRHALDQAGQPETVHLPEPTDDDPDGHIYHATTLHPPADD